MKLFSVNLLSLLLGVCFVFTFSQKTFACGCQDDKKADQTTMATKIADAKDTKASESHTCSASDKQCTEGKECSCSKDKMGKMHKHKDGKPCDCASKSGKMAS